MARQSKHIDPVQAAFDAATKSKAAAKDLADGAIRCSIPGCGGIVKPKYILPTPAGVPQIGMCPQKELHMALAAKDPTVKRVQGQLLSLYRLSRLA